MNSQSKASPPFNLSRRFLILAFVSIGLVSIVSSLLLSRFLTQRMLLQDAEAIMGYVQGIVKVEGADSFFVGQDIPDSDLGDFFIHMASLPDMVRANVYSRDGTVLWSSDRALTGRKFSDNPDLAASLDGKLQFELGIAGEDIPVKSEHIFLDRSHTHFVEIYVPVIQPGDGQVLGTIEIYREPNTLFEAIRTGHRLIWTIAILGGLFLYVTLFWMVRRADRLIRTQQEQLVESETLAAVGEMASAVAHGIRNPLASIRSSAELWQCLDGAGGGEPALDIISQVDRMEKWVRDLLTYSQPGDDTLEPVELSAVMHESLRNFSQEAEKRHVTVCLQLHEPLPPVKGEPALLCQILNNLIANALEAMHGGGRLTVSTAIARSRGHLELCISDTGVGISADQIDKVCDPFFTTKQKGLGVGLTLVRRIVRRFGGSMGIESQPGLGTRVTLNLLLAR